MAALVPGARFAGATIVAELGRGAMGRVFRARDGLGRDVALKVLLRAPDAEDLERFVREGQAMAAVPPHPGVVGVHSAGVEHGVAYLVMDLIEGESLADLLVRGPLPGERIRELGAQIADALAHVHAAGVVHRDLKPANVMIRRDGERPLISDFGLAGVSGAERLTLTGDVLGTPLYMPPEQILGQRAAIGAPADVWALGAILYEMARGAPPFSGMDLEHQTRLVTQAEPRPLADAELQSIVLRALAKQAAARPSADEVAQALRGTPPEGWSARDARPPVRERPAWVVPAAGALAVGVAIAAVAVAVSVQRARRLAGLRADVAHLAAVAAPLDPGWLDVGPPVDPSQIAEFAGEFAALRVASGDAAVDLDDLQGTLLRVRFGQALRERRWDEATRVLEAAPAAAQVVFGARLAVARREPVPAADLRRVIDGEDRALAEAAAVLLARSLATTDGAEALRLLSSRNVSREVAGRERLRIRTLQAVADQDLRALTAALEDGAPDATLEEAYRLGVERLRQAVGASDSRPIGAALELLAALHVASGSPSLEAARAPEAVAIAGDVCQHTLAAAQADRTRQAAQVVSALARSGLRPEDQALRVLGEDLFYFLRARSDADVALNAEFLVAFVRLDFPMPPRSLRGPVFMELSAALGAGVEVRYLELRARALQGLPDEVGPARRRLLELVRDAERDGTLGPRVRAQALAEAFEDSSLTPAARAALAEEVLQLDPASPWGFMLRARVHAERYDREAALAALEEGALAYRRRYGPVFREIIQHRVYVHALLGDREAVEASLAEMEAAVGASDALEGLRRYAHAILRQREGSK